MQIGQPVNLFANNNAASTGNAYPYKTVDPFKVGGTPTSTNMVCATKTRTVATRFNPCAFVNPPKVIAAVNPMTGQSNVGGPGQILANAPNAATIAYGAPGRNQIYGPGYNRTDFSAFKSFAAVRETNVQLQADIFNLWNTPAYGQPGNTTGGCFGQINSERVWRRRYCR